MIPVFLDPLKKFEVVLKTTFDETIYWDGFIDVMGCESLLEDFKVLNIFVFIFRIELLLSLSHQMKFTLTLLRFTSTGALVR